jgi:hypothetical protein
MSNESKKDVKEIQEIDYSVYNQGPLFIDPKHKKSGFEYCLVSNKPGEIEMYQRWGYNVVQDDNIEVGKEVASKSNPLGSVVSVQSKCGQLLILMAISKELHARLTAYRENEVKKTSASIGHIDGIPDGHQYGSVTVSNNRH